MLPALPPGPHLARLRALAIRPLYNSPTVNGHRGRAVAIAPCNMPSTAEVEIDRLSVREMT